jgi:hypothetical protein
MKDYLAESRWLSEDFRKTALDIWWGARNGVPLKDACDLHEELLNRQSQCGLTEDNQLNAEGFVLEDWIELVFVECVRART